MKHLGSIDEKEREHYVYCMQCEAWYDLRDLKAVFDHEHWMKKMPDLRFSHVRKKGKTDEIYFKQRGKVITLRLLGNYKKGQTF
jgi:hypothetical protein